MYAGISSPFLYLPVHTNIFRSRLFTLCVPLLKCADVVAVTFGAAEQNCLKLIAARLRRVMMFINCDDIFA